MIAINNQGLLNVCFCCNSVGFIPKVSYSYNAETKKLTVTETSTFPEGQTLKALNILVSDRNGSVVIEQITTAGGSKEINLPNGFITNDGFNILCTIVTDNRLIADLSAYNVASQIGSSTGIIN